MFTGFATENTPATQIWDFSNPLSGAIINRIGLTDDCAPIQIFKTGGTTTQINLYLPTAPIEGKTITICNQCFTSSTQSISVLSSDTSGNGSGTAIYTLGASGYIVLVYSKQFISYGSLIGTSQTGWITLNQSSASSSTVGSILLGGNNNTAYNQYSAVLAGTSNVVSNTNSVVIGGNNNQATGGYSFVIGGNGNTMGRGYGGILGGQGNNANTGADGSVIIGGTNNTITGGNAVILGGAFNRSSSTYGVVLGGRYATTRAIVGNITATANNDALGQSILGSNQFAFLVLSVRTTDATATILRSTTSAADTTNQVILPNNSAYYFRGSVIAGKTGAGDAKNWSIEGVIKRGANAASTVFVGTPAVTSLYADAGAATWALTATTDVTNGGLAITVTGQAATTIQWVCKIETTEMNF